MIRPNMKMGIVYCDHSKLYVNEVNEIIRNRRSEGYCIETIVVCDDLVDSGTMQEELVFNNLDKCDYGIVFLTKD